MKTQKPRNKAQFDKRRDRLRDLSPIHSVDALFNMECEIIVCYYHGGYIRAGWCLFWRGVTSFLRNTYWSLVYRFCDKVGWTRLQAIPGTDAFERHSGKCDKMNCNDTNCIHSGIPKWFRRLARMEDF